MESRPFCMHVATVEAHWEGLLSDFCQHARNDQCDLHGHNGFFTYSNSQIALTCNSKVYLPDLAAVPSLVPNQVNRGRGGW